MPTLSIRNYSLILLRLDALADSDDLPNFSHADIRGLKKLIKRATDDLVTIPATDDHDELLPLRADVICAFEAAKPLIAATTRVLKAIRKRLRRNPDSPLTAQDLAIMDLYDSAVELKERAETAKAKLIEDGEDFSLDDDDSDDSDDDSEEDSDDDSEDDDSDVDVSDDDSDDDDSDEEEDDQDDDDQEDDESEEDDDSEDDEDEQADLQPSVTKAPAPAAPTQTHPAKTPAPSNDPPDWLPAPDGTMMPPLLAKLMHRAAAKREAEGLPPIPIPG